MTIVMVTHDLSEAFRLGTRVLVLDRPFPDDPTRGAQITFDIPVRPRPAPPAVFSPVAEPAALARVSMTARATVTTAPATV